MQAVLHRLLLAWACLLGASAWAADPVAVPPLTARVTDLTATLSAAEREQLEQQLAAFEQRRGSQIAILIVPTTRPEPIEAYSIRVAEEWKIGRRGSDDGVILLVAKDDRALRIEVGYGLEGAIPDAIARRVIAETIVPKFRQGDFHGGLLDGVAQIQSLIEGERLPPPRARGAQSDFGGGFPELLVTGMVVAMTLGGILNLILGRLLGSGIAGCVVGGIAWLLTGSLLTGIVAAIAAFVFALLFAGRGAVGRHGGWGGGGGGGWSGGGGGGWSGGGGGFGGGGASGRW